MLRYIDSVVDNDDNERLTVEGRDLYQEIQRQDEADLQETYELAGLKPLPINRMRTQAGREVNRYTTTGQFGQPMRGRDNQIIRDPDGTPRFFDKRRVQRGEQFYDRKRDDIFNGRIPPEMKQRLLERQQRVTDAIDNWDPIEASAREDYNRLRGGNVPIVNPGALPLADELIQTIETPIAPATSQMDRYGI